MTDNYGAQLPTTVPTPVAAALLGIHPTSLNNMARSGRPVTAADGSVVGFVQVGNRRSWWTNQLFAGSGLDATEQIAAITAAENSAALPAARRAA